MKNHFLLFAAMFLFACGNSSRKPLSNDNIPEASSTVAVTSSPMTSPKRSVLDDPVINARTLIRDDDNGKQWADEKDPRVQPAAKRIESITKLTGENASSVMLAIGGAASRLKVTRMQLLADVDDALTKGTLRRGQGTTLGMDVWEWALPKYKRK